MSAKRDAAIKHVDAAFAVGAISWDAVQELVHAFPRRGILDAYAKGQDDEGEVPGGQPWTDGEDTSLEAERNVEAGGAGGDVALLSEAGDTGRRRQ